MNSSMSGVEGSRSSWMVPGHSRQSGPFSRYSRTMDSEVFDWQGRQIVQSHLDLDDFLPLFASPEPRLFGLQGNSRIDPRGPKSRSKCSTGRYRQAPGYGCDDDHRVARRNPEEE